LSKESLALKSICPNCGASIPDSAAKCWLCGYENLPLNPFAVSPIESSTIDVTPKPAVTSASNLLFGLLLALCIALTLLIGVGLGIDQPGALVPYSILVGPALLITLARSLEQAQPGQKNSMSRLFSTFLVSMLATIGIIFLLLLAAAILLIVICIQSPPSFH
jgi:ribosomal protein L40E